MALDPICGMTVNAASALGAERAGHMCSFCGEHCRQKFLSTSAAAKHEEKPPGKAIYTSRCTRKCSRTIPAIAPSAAWQSHGPVARSATFFGNHLLKGKENARSSS